jgi:hypothetical protein
MAIADLYNAQNVVVGQAAVLFAPANTPLPNLNTISFADPLAATPWTPWTINGAVAPVTTFTLSYGGNTTSALTVSGLTAAQITTALSSLASVGAGNVVVGGSAATGWTISFTGTAANKGALTAAGTGGTVTVAGGLWTPCGATDQGWKFGTNKSTTPTTIEEQSTPVGTQITAQSVTIDGALSEEITSTLALAYNATVTTTAQATGVPGTDELNPTDTVLQYAIAMLAVTTGGLPSLYYAPQWTQLANVSADFRRAAAKHMYPVSFATVCKPNQIRIIRFKTPGL